MRNRQAGLKRQSRGITMFGITLLNVEENYECALASHAFPLTDLLWAAALCMCVCSATVLSPLVPVPVPDPQVC